MIITVRKRRRARDEEIIARLSRLANSRKELLLESYYWLSFTTISTNGRVDECNVGAVSRSELGHGVDGGATCAMCLHFGAKARSLDSRTGTPRPRARTEQASEACIGLAPLNTDGLKRRGQSKSKALVKEVNLVVLSDLRDCFARCAKGGSSISPRRTDRISYGVQKDSR